MKRFILAAAAVACAGIGTAASAAPTISFGTPDASGAVSGTFGNEAIRRGTFTDTFSFTLPAGFASTTISSSFFTNRRNNIDFTSVTLNGVDFDIGSTGNVEFRSLVGAPVMAGLQTITVIGTSGGTGSYSGTISFSPGAVPEPASWAMLIGGIGMAGAALRRRRQAGKAAIA